MLLGLVPGVVVGGGVVEFVEADCVAPAGDGAGGLVGLTGLVPGIFEGFVGGHGRQDRRCWLRVRTVRRMPWWSRSIWRNWAFVLSIWLVIAGIGWVQVGSR